MGRGKMSNFTSDRPNEKRRRSWNDLLLWLALLPLILGSLVCSGQLALLVNLKSFSADTSTRLFASYLPWPYDKIPPLNLPALIKDIENDERAAGALATPVAIVTGEFLVPPTPTASATPQVISTSTPVFYPSSTPEIPLPQATPSPTRMPPSSTPTTQPTATATATRIPTRVFTSTPLPPPTETEAPPPPSATPTRVPPTATPTQPTPTTPPQPTATPTKPPSPTAPPPTPTPTVPTPTYAPPTVTPTYAPVRPVAENDGVSEAVPEGCRAYFGYRNDNPQEVDIPLGPRNLISDDTAAISPGLTTHFLVGRVFGVFEVVWNSGGPIIWTLDGRSASANWCGP